MSEGFYAKMSLLAWRKSTSALSYSKESVVPMSTTLPLGSVGVYEDLLGALYRLKRPSQPLGVGCFFGDLLPKGRKLYGGDDCCGVIVALDFVLVGTLKGGADGDDPVWARHL